MKKSKLFFVYLISVNYKLELIKEFLSILHYFFSSLFLYLKSLK